MASIYRPPIYGRLLDFLIEKATPQEILGFTATADEQAHADDLVERLSAGTLTPDEITEIEQMREFDEWVSLLKARALEALNRS
jgi:hypothetical protein